MLYPLKFQPIYKTKLWGGQKIAEKLNKQNIPPHCGESWEISCISDNVSIISNGFLKGNNLQEILEIYMADLIGKNNYEKFGNEFPLLIKYIDASQQLSIQVHPNDDLAKEHHHAYGKTEMWYILNAENDSVIITGFKEEITKEKFEKQIQNNQTTKSLNIEKDVKPSDVFFIPAGRIHSIGQGILLAEIQQTSDITYRVHDWNRKDMDGNLRPLHVNLALDAIDYSYFSSYKTPYDKETNTANKIVNSPFFTTNYLPINQELKRSFFIEDTFVIYMAISGNFLIKYGDFTEEVLHGETVLIPAEISDFSLVPQNNIVEILEIYIYNKDDN